MQHHLTIGYITARQNPHFDWFLSSLANQITPEDAPNISIIVIDRHWDDLGRPEQVFDTFQISFDKIPGVRLKGSAPKPCVWQGRYRLTKEDWFACANARNTALCLSPDGWIAYVDDLSVLMPGWLDRVKAAMAGNYVVFGAYQKVTGLKVLEGHVLDYKVSEQGMDARLLDAKEDLLSCSGQWLFGCSLAGPVEAFLTVNGFPEICDGMGFEDSIMGVVIGNTNKYGFRYDKKMMTLESEDHHGIEPALRRTDKGVSPRDKSHAVLNLAYQSKEFPNFFGEEGIRGLRQRVLSGEPFPITGIPEHDWYDSQPIREMI